MAVMVLAAAWAAFLVLTGGADIEIAGRTISSHEPRRPLLIFSVAFAAWLLSTSAAGTASHRWLRLRVDDRLIVGAIAVAVLYVGVRDGTKTAGGADSYSYIAQAQSWVRGSLRSPLPWTEPVPWPYASWTAAPFGYAGTDDDTAVVPVVPPGLPLMMAGAALAGGYCAMFWVVPMSGAVLVIGTYLLGRRLGGSRPALGAAALVAASPVFLFHLPQPMSDVPAAAAWTLAFLLLASRSAMATGGAGLATAVALLIRPNLAPLALLLPAWLAYKAIRAGDRSERRQRAVQIATFLAGLAPAAIVLALFNWHVYGAPWRFGYRSAGSFFALSHIWPNVRNYSSWFVSIQTVLPLAGLALLLIPAVARWARVPDPSFTWLLGAFSSLLVGEYLLYIPFDRWFYLRFLLPAFPLLAIALMLLARRVSQSVPLGLGPVVVALVVGALLVRGVTLGAKEHAFDVWLLESRYVSIARAVAGQTQREDLVMAGQLGGAVRHYAGRLTFNYAELDAAWLDRTVAWFEARGVRLYVLLDDWEVADFRQRFATQTLVSRLDAAPVLAFDGASTTQLFDFGDGTLARPTVRVREAPPPRAECAMPADPPPPVPRSR